ncbi:MAG: adenine phosphoribosyltransferase, partial [Pseudomonadota bacterium]
QKIAGIEARGFVFGAALADRLGLGFIPVRKLGKLPAETYKQSYKLEYGEDSLEIHQDAVEAGERVLIIDDLLATGGTVGAAAKLLHHVKADLVGAAFVVELPELGGREHLTSMGIDVLSLIEFEGH